jgi:hypothetical protein
MESDALKLTLGGAASVLLTVLSSINSVMKPTERYHGYVAAAIEIQSITVDLELGMRVPDARDGLDEVAFLKRMNSRITTVGEAMASLPIPRLSL